MAQVQAQREQSAAVRHRARFSSPVHLALGQRGLLEFQMGTQQVAQGWSGVLRFGGKGEDQHRQASFDKRTRSSAESSMS